MLAPKFILPGDESDFPDINLALEDPDGLLAVGGDLSSERLIKAYQQGIFPWYSDGQPILWWSPNPRLVLFPENLHISRSLQKLLRKQTPTFTFDRAFESVMWECAQPRQNQDGTWITNEMIEAYVQLHRQGIAHSVEAWQNDRLVGGLYGVAIGQVFFGESMFTHIPNASKLAFVHLVRQLQQWQFKLIDCQVTTGHLLSLGAQEIPRTEFKAILEKWCKHKANEWRQGE